MADAVRASVMEILPADACVFFLVDEGTSELWDEKYGKETGVPFCPEIPALSPATPFLCLY